MESVAAKVLASLAEATAAARRTCEVVMRALGFEQMKVGAHKMHVYDDEIGTIDCEHAIMYKDATDGILRLTGDDGTLHSSTRLARVWDLPSFVGKISFVDIKRDAKELRERMTDEEFNVHSDPKGEEPDIMALMAATGALTGCATLAISWLAPM